jgi:hypothetical protein
MHVTTHHTTNHGHLFLRTQYGMVVWYGGTTITISPHTILPRLFALRHAMRKTKTHIYRGIVISQKTVHISLVDITHVNGGSPGYHCKKKLSRNSAKLERTQQCFSRSLCFPFSRQGAKKIRSSRNKYLWYNLYYFTIRHGHCKSALPYSYVAAHSWRASMPGIFDFGWWVSVDRPD